MVRREEVMKKPTEPKRPEVPAILKKMDEDPDYHEPKEFLEKTLFKTPTYFEVALGNLDKEGLSNEEIAERLSTENNWDITWDEEDNDWLCDGDFDSNPDDLIENDHATSGSEEVNLTELAKQLEPGQELFVRGIANYKGNYIWSDPGLHIYTRVKNPDYKEQVKAHKVFKKEMEAFRRAWFDWDEKKTQVRTVQRTKNCRVEKEVRGRFRLTQAGIV